MTHTVDRDYPWQLAGSAEQHLQRARQRPSEWALTFSRIVTASDFVVVLVATVSTHLLWFGLEQVEVSSDAPFTVDYFLFSPALVVAWMIALGTRRAGLGGWMNHLVGGSTAGRLAHTQPVPVTIVPQHPKESP